MPSNFSLNYQHFTMQFLSCFTICNKHLVPNDISVVSHSFIPHTHHMLSTMLHSSLFTSFIIVPVWSMKNTLFNIPVLHVFLSLVSNVLLKKMSVIYLIIVIAAKVLEILLYWYILHVANSTYQMISVSKI